MSRDTKSETLEELLAALLCLEGERFLAALPLTWLLGTHALTLDSRKPEIGEALYPIHS